MWSPPSTRQSRGIECVYQPLKKHYRRSLGGVSACSKSLTWARKRSVTRPRIHQTGICDGGWLGGGGGFKNLMRQGLYSLVAETSKNFMSETSGAIGSKARLPPIVITSPTGDACAGWRCAGRRFVQRTAWASVACWNSVNGRKPVHASASERISSPR